MSILQEFSLEKKVAIVTGGAQGIGKTASFAFASAGAQIGIVDLNIDLATKTAAAIKEKHGVETIAIRADLTKPADVNAMVEQIKKKFNRLDIIFNNAGICINEPAETMSFESWNKVLTINLTGVFLCAQAAAKLMIPQKSGSIINMASMSAHIVNTPQPQCAYNASKSGVVQLTRSLAVEWAKYNIRVNSLSPGYIETELTAHMSKEWKDRWLDLSVIKRLGKPEDLTGILVYLASDKSLFTTGADFGVNGGFTCL